MELDNKEDIQGLGKYYAEVQQAQKGPNRFFFNDENNKSIV